MLLGTSKRKITPKFPLRLAGYATREGNYTEVLEDIFLRVFWFKSSNHHSGEVIIYGDLLWFGDDFVKEIKDEISKKLEDLNPEHVQFCASHNHSGPGISRQFTDILETCNSEYREWLLNRIIKTLKEAEENMEEVTAVRYEGEANLNVYRRKKIDSEILMMPNYEIPCNKNLNIIAFHRKDSTLKGTMVHYPCHANISSENKISPDFPGVMLRMMDDEIENSISIFLQGATADIRPNVILGEKFIALGYDHVKLFATQLFERVISTMKTNPTAKITVPNLKYAHKIKLGQDEIMLKNEIIALSEAGTMLEKQWASKVLEKDARLYEELDVRMFDFGEGLQLFFLNAEISQHYEYEIQKIYPQGLVVAYSNGMIGYVSDEIQITEGGYEPKGSGIYFALTGTYNKKIEKDIITGIKKMKGV